MHGEMLLTDLSCCERLTLWVIRRFARARRSRCEGSSCLVRGIFWPCFREDFDGVAELLAEAFNRHSGGPDAPIAVAAPGHPALTAVERALLSATACLQSGDEDGACARLEAGFAGGGRIFLPAVTLMATRLACAGHWLPDEPGSHPGRDVDRDSMGWTASGDGPASVVGAAALGTMRRQGHGAIEQSYIMWPRPAGGR